MRTRDRLCVCFGAAALLVSTLVVGGALRWTQAIVAGLVALSIATQFSARRRLGGVAPIVALLGVAALLCVVQMIPLPASLVAVLNPVNAGLRSDGAALAHTSPWPSISMDVAGTLGTFAFLVTLFGVALVSLRLAVAQRGRFLLLAGVALSCGLVALVSALHSIVNASTIYGIYDVPASTTVVGPFINPNHLGCLMALGATLSLGLAFYQHQRSGWRATWVLTGAACAAIALLSQSRGAAVGLAIGFVVAGGILIGQRIGDVSRRANRTLSTGALPLIIVLSVGFGLAVYSSAGGVADQLGRTHLNELDSPTSKFSAWKSAPDVIRESPWVGVGGGAMESVFTHAFPGTAHATYRHVENEYIEAFIEYGVPGGIALALLFGWTMLTTLRKWRGGPLAAAALGGLAGIAFQSSFDFGIRLIGIAVPATVVACTLQLVPLREIEQRVRQRIIRGAVVAALALATLLLASRVTTTIYEDHEMLAANPRPTMNDIAEVAQRHPLDYFAFGTAGQQLVRERDPRAGEMLNHALRLHPFHPGLHRIVARVLVAKGAKTQAALEYATAMNGAPTHTLLKEILAVLPAASDAVLAIPLDYHAPATVLRSLSELKRDDVSLEWLKRRVLLRESDDIDLVDRLYDIATERKDYPTASAAALRRLAIADTKMSKLKLASAYFATKDYAAVYKTLDGVEAWTGSIEERGTAWLLVCDSLAAEEKWDDSLRCLRRLDASGSLATRRQEIVRRERDVHEASGKQTPMTPASLGPTSRPSRAIPNPLTEGGTRRSIPNPLVPRRE